MEQISQFKEIVTKLDGAFRSFCIPSIELKGFKITKVLDVNKGRHKYIEAGNKRFCFIYKRAMFGSYSRQFNNVSNLGESINIDRLYWCIDHNVDYILIGYPDGKIYCLNPLDWKSYCDSNNTYRKVEKVEYDKRLGKEIARIEATASLPITELIRWNL